MDRNEQKIATEKAPMRSPFAEEKSYGEKKFDRIFGTLTNFWANLLLSGVFSFWVKHSRNPIKLPFVEKEFVSLNEWQSRLINRLDGHAVMKSIENPVIRHKRSEAIVNLFTLLIPGHFIMIPSVWLGSKFKEPLVRHWDKKHYGAEAMEHPDMVARHLTLATEDKPTFFGAVVGRLGTVAATTATARIIGSEENWANVLGEKINSGALKRFKGMDPVASEVGSEIGGIMEKLAPKRIKALNNHFAANGYTWSEAQIKDVALGKSSLPVAGPYTHGVDDASRYIAQDVMYTFITSAGIHPIMRLLNKVLPGMKYTPKLTSEQMIAIDPKLAALPTAAPVLRVIPADTEKEPALIPTKEHAKESARKDDDAPLHHEEKHHGHATPHAHVSHIHTQSTIHHRPEHLVEHAG